MTWVSEASRQQAVSSAAYLRKLASKCLASIGRSCSQWRSADPLLAWVPLYHRPQAPPMGLRRGACRPLPPCQASQQHAAALWPLSFLKLSKHHERQPACLCRRRDMQHLHLLHLPVAWCAGALAKGGELRGPAGYLAPSHTRRHTPVDRQSSRNCSTLEKVAV